MKNISILLLLLTLQSYCTGSSIISNALSSHYQRELQSDSNIVLPDLLGNAMKLLQPLLQDEIVKSFPASYGNCNDMDPPLPCRDNGGDLYNQKSTWSHVKIRWIAGLNNIIVDTLEYKWNEETLQMSLHLGLLFPSLPMSIQAKVCAGSLGCTTAFDNTDACCGPNRRLDATITVGCSDTFPHLHSSSISSIEISPPLEVTASVLGKYDLKLQDITGQVEDEIRKTAESFLNEETMADLNDVVKSIGGNSISCKPLPPTTEPPTTTATPDAVIVDQTPDNVQDTEADNTLFSASDLSATPAFMVAILLGAATVAFNSFLFRK